MDGKLGRMNGIKGANLSCGGGASRCMRAKAARRAGG